MKEIWKDIPGFEGSYQASDRGRVRSLNRIIKQKNRWGKLNKNRLKGKVLKLLPNVGGYLSLRLGRGNPIMVHQVVALTFIGPTPDGFYVCHKDHIKTNNNLLNLKHDTPLNNQRERKENGTHIFGERHYLSKLTDKKVRKIKSLLGVISQAELAKRFKVSRGAISQISIGRSWTHVK